MPTTAIDQAPSLTSIRLKVPTGTVPIPPEGYGQLHTTGEGQLAVRLPDGSVVVVGSGGGGGGDTISGDGGAVSADATPGHDPGVVLSPNLGKTIWLNGSVVGPGENQPFGVVVQPVLVPASEVLTLHTVRKTLAAAPGVGRRVWPLGLFVHYRFENDPYLSNPDVEAGYDTEDGWWPALSVSSGINSSADHDTSVLWGTGSSVSQPGSYSEDKALQVQLSIAALPGLASAGDLLILAPYVVVAA